MVNKLSENKNNPKKLWQNLKTRGYSTNGEESGKIVLDKEGVKIHESKDVANHFDIFFLQKLLPNSLKIFPGLMVLLNPSLRGSVSSVIMLLETLFRFRK